MSISDKFQQTEDLHPNDCIMKMKISHIMTDCMIKNAVCVVGFYYDFILSSTPQYGGG